MRKVEEQIIEAIKSGKNRTVSNTTVYHKDGEAHVSLHGNPIAIIGPDYASMTLAGWNTPTTRSRLNALCNAFAPAFGFGQRQFVPFLYVEHEPHKIYERDWYKLTGNTFRAIDA